MSEIKNIEEFVSPLKVVELRDELRKRNLGTAGTKSVLAQRLQDYLLKEKEEGVVASSANGQEGEKAESEKETEEAPEVESKDQEAEPGEKETEPEAGAAAAEEQKPQEEQAEAADIEEVKDQVVQTEASGEAVSKMADPQGEC